MFRTLLRARWFRILSGVVLLALTIAFALTIVAWVLLRGSLPPLRGEREVEGIAGEVSVERDRFGVVTIHAKDDLDLVFATGFVHAQDRFFQMDLMRRSAAGELAALVGPAALEADRRARRHRFRAEAESVLARAETMERRKLEAYSRGVAAGLSSLRARPFEYLVLRRSPAPWRPADSILVLLAMFRDLQDEDNHLEQLRDTLDQTLPPALVRFLLPEASRFDAPLQAEELEEATLPSAEALSRPTLPHPTAPPSSGEPTSRPSPATRRGAREEGRGSNAWAVGGRYTPHGGALLSVDMHLGLRIPNIWYRLRLRRPPGPAVGALDATGLSLPGTPALVVGSNGHLAWGFTNSYGDYVDFVPLDVDPQRPGYYRADGRWRAIEEIVERIEVARAPAESLVVQQTIWGPVVGRGLDGRPWALHWVAHDPGAVNLALMDMVELDDLDRALDLAARCGIPHQNLVLAHRDGSVAWTVMGRLPRRPGADFGRPRPAPDDESGWGGWLKPEEIPRLRRGPLGRIWSANAREIDLDSQRQLGDGGWALGARAQQIRDDLRELEHADEAAMLAIQLDDRALFLQRWHDLLLRELAPLRADRSRLDALAREVEEWRGHAAVGSVGYRLVRAYRGWVERLVFEPLTAGCRDRDPDFDWRWLPRREVPLWTLLRERPAHLLPSAFADWDSLLVAAADSLLDEVGGTDLASFTWGQRNRSRIAHPLASVLGPLRRWLTMRSQEQAGDRYMPRVAAPRFGASERMIVEVGHEENGILLMPGGQSGHPLSPHFSDQQEAWARAEARPFLPSAPVHRLVLRPRTR